MANKKIQWEVASYRLTLFPKIDANVNLLSPDFASRIWPDGKDVKKTSEKLIDQKPQILLEGKYEDSKLILNLTPFRIDLNYLPKDQVNLSTFSLQSLGIFEDSLIKLQTLTKNWFNKLSTMEFSRLAFSTDLIHRVENHEAGYNLVSTYLPFKVDPSTSTDFRYQINKFTSSKIVDGLRINRISLWDVLKFDLELSPSGLSESAIKKEDMFYAHLNFDINTDQSSKNVYKGKELTTMFDELISEGVEISEKGVK